MSTSSYGEAFRDFRCSPNFVATFECEGCHKKFSVQMEEPSSRHFYRDGTSSTFFRAPIPEGWSKASLRQCAECFAAYEARMAPIRRAEMDAAEARGIAQFRRLLDASDYDGILAIARNEGVHRAGRLLELLVGAVRSGGEPQQGAPHSPDGEGARKA